MRTSFRLGNSGRMKCWSITNKVYSTILSVYHSIRLLLVVLIITSASSCKKDYIYELKDVTVTQPGGGKGNVKTTTEFISIVYSDLFNTNIPTDTLLYVQQAYDAFGDKKLIEDRIVRHFLKTASQIPSDTTMRANVPLFVDETFQKFFNRKTDAFENYFISNLIRNSASITPVIVYYACMTSDEYRYY